MLPYVEAGVGQFRWYWGNNIAFSAGVEAAGWYWTQSTGREYPPYWPILSSVELVVPHIGVALLGKPRPTLLSRCISPKYKAPGSFVPRVEIFSGIVPVALNTGGEWVYFNTIRTELKAFLTRGVSAAQVLSLRVSRFRIILWKKLSSSLLMFFVRNRFRSREMTYWMRLSSQS
jgi:hypothetical protein